MGGEPDFDARISSGFRCGWCYSIHRESLFLVVVALRICTITNVHAVIKNRILRIPCIIPYILYRTNDDKSVPAADLSSNLSFLMHMSGVDLIPINNGQNLSILQNKIGILMQDPFRGGAYNLQSISTTPGESSLVHET